MLYSRWFHSRWYAYRVKASTRDNNLFVVSCVQGYLYRMIKDDMQGCLDDVKDKCPDATDKQIKELKNYMERFIKDVEEDYSAR